MFINIIHGQNKHTNSILLAGQVKVIINDIESIIDSDKQSTHNLVLYGNVDCKVDQFVAEKDIQNNNKYEGYFINDNEIVKTIDLRFYKNGVGNGITRLLFDTAILLYVDRFCPTERPSIKDKEMLEKQFVVYAFIWAYSLRAQYYNLGWQSAQNYIFGNGAKNSFNIY